MTFEQWMVYVDSELLREIGLTHRDLADHTYRDDYESGEDPKVTAHTVLFNEGLS
ncbi:hypothetical protein SEA_TROOPER_89 [Mycobacterium phage Trooper]|nr:hypothetical protein SEA_TROOPER_89 [Mycobacterium phage Trooper]